MGFVGIILLAVGIILFIVGIKVKNTAKKIKENGKKVNALVTSCEPIIALDSDGNEIKAGYKTNFEFNYNGNLVNYEYKADTRYDINKQYESVYLPDSKGGILYVGTVSSSESLNDGAFIMWLFGAVFMTGGIVTVFELSITILIIAILIFVLIGVFPRLFTAIKQNGSSKGKDSINPFYIDPDSLIRYVPKGDKNDKSQKPITNNVGTVHIIFCLLFLILGLLVMSLGIKEFKNSLIIKTSWPETNAKIVGINTKKYKDNEGNEQTTTYIEYEFKIDENSYKFVQEKVLFQDNEYGKEVAVYYNKTNPEEAYLKFGIFSSSFILLIGFMFAYCGVYIFVSEKKKLNSYMKNTSLGGRIL